ncbi:hypothetical protein MTR67_041263 [Solanum verrucosum]|nr:hypothetical protein MTR67_041263 [Solanum verrucosum]
MVSIHGP